MWKKRWKILRDMPSYPFAKQVKIVIATMALHNYIRKHGRCDRQFEKMNIKMTNKNTSLDDEGEEYAVEGEGAEEEEEEEEEEYRNTTGATSQIMNSIRDNIATSLMDARN